MCTITVPTLTIITCVTHLTNTVGIQITYTLNGPTGSQRISATNLQKRHLLTSNVYFVKGEALSYTEAVGRAWA